MTEVVYTPPTGREAQLRHVHYDADMDCQVAACGRCHEEYPLTSEFWPPHRLFKTRSGQWCLACRAESR